MQRFFAQLYLLLVIARVWRKYPGLRFCQFLENCFEINDLYYITDDDLIKQVLKYEQKIKQSIKNDLSGLQ